jgi:hypothetical protein
MDDLEKYIEKRKKSSPEFVSAHKKICYIKNRESCGRY